MTGDLNMIMKKDFNWIFRIKNIKINKMTQIKCAILSFVFLFLVFSGFAQTHIKDKPAINFSACKNWESIASGAFDITNDGQYVMYRIENQSQALPVVLQSSDGSWKKSLPSGSTAFTGNSKFAISKIKDSLALITLGTNKISYVPKISSYKLPMASKGGWLAYLSASGNRELVVKKLSGNQQYLFNGVNEYFFSENGEKIAVKSERKLDGLIETKIYWLDLLSGKRKEIFEVKNSDTKDFKFNSGGQMIFTAVDKIDGTSVWYYNSKQETAVKLLDENAPLFKKEKKDLGIVEIDFCNGGKSLMINLRENIIEEKSKVAKVSIWNYKDSRLPLTQTPARYSALFNLMNNNLMWLAKEGQQTVASANNNKWLVFVERDWNTLNEFPNAYMVTADSEAPISLPGFDKKEPYNFNFSPNGDFIVYYDSIRSCWLSYNTNDFSITNISKNLKKDWILEWIDRPLAGYQRVVSWLEKNGGVIIPDGNDLWWMDLNGKAMPINITNGYGRKNDIYFQLGTGDYEFAIKSLKDRVILHGFNLKTKKSGFYSKILGTITDPSLLSEANRYDVGVGTFDIGFRGRLPKKAVDGNTYLLTRSESSGSPNVFTTKDFKNFRRLSNTYPERNYNWYTTELCNWTAYDNKPAQGILYKPENFDSSKKYPVIITYYEKKSDGLNTFIEPDVFLGGVNIPWLVSNGYLVFTPDIHYQIGNPGLSAYNYVGSGADYLVSLSYVDAKKVAISGQSMGGYETNAILTQTTRFAAALSTCGISNLTSYFGSLWGAGSGESTQVFTLYGQPRMGNTPWERPDLYIKNSPIFSADKVTTPILMMANRNDLNMPFAQGVEFFTALRRLKKPSWMLDYDEGNHLLFGKDLREDFTTRVMQFFDHYLKDRPAPVWMTKGISQLHRTRDYAKGLELDGTGEKP